MYTLYGQMLGSHVIIKQVEEEYRKHDERWRCQYVTEKELYYLPTYTT